MNSEPKRPDQTQAPGTSADRLLEAGYAEWLAQEIVEGERDLDAGEGIPAEEVWRRLGLE